MSSRRSPRQLLVAVLLGVLVGGGLMAVTPAGAEVSNAVATNWKKIWKKNLKPLADKRYSTKKQSDATYATKAEAAAAAAATDSKLGGYYKKSEIDAKLAPLVNSVAATAGGDQSVAIPGPAQIVRSVSLMPPANGMVAVTSSVYIYSSGPGFTRCSQSLNSVTDDASSAYLVATTAGEYEAIGLTRGYTVTKGSLFTVNLICEGAGTSTARDSNITAIFAPS